MNLFCKCYEMQSKNSGLKKRVYLDTLFYIKERPLEIASGQNGNAFKCVYLLFREKYPSDQCVKKTNN